MRYSFRSALAGVAGLAACLLLSGCGGTTIYGKLTDNGKPLTVTDKGVFVVALVPDGGSGPTCPADTKSDGTFTVQGPNKGGVPAGKYKVTIQQLDPYPNNDKLGGKFSADKTPIVRDVPSGNFDIDIAKP